MLFLWAELYHAQSGEKPLRLRKTIPIFVFVNICAYVAIIVFEILDLVNSDPDDSPVSAVKTFYQRMVAVLYVVCYELTALAFLYYGVSFYRRMIFESLVVKRVLIFSLIFSIIFTGRAIIILVDDIYRLRISGCHCFDFVYYVVLELFPVYIMLIKVPSDMRRLMIGDQPTRTTPTGFSSRKKVYSEDFGNIADSEKARLIINK